MVVSKLSVGLCIAAVMSGGCSQRQSAEGRYVLREVEISKGFSGRLERETNKELILLDTETGMTWRYFDYSMNGMSTVQWLPLGHTNILFQPIVKFPASTVSNSQ